MFYDEAVKQLLPSLLLGRLHSGSKISDLVNTSVAFFSYFVPSSPTSECALCLDGDQASGSFHTL